MADFREELIKLRLRLLEQKIRSESSRKSAGVYDNSLASSSSGLQQLLQVETLKSNQLLQKVKVRRQQEENTPNQNHGGDSRKELMTMMMSQNMQLQQLLLQQVVGSHPTENTLHHTRLSTVRPLEVEQTGHREMTPFTTLPSSNHAQKAKPPLQVKGPPVPVKRKPSPKPLVARGVATPVRPTERVPEPQMRPRTTRNPEGFLGQIAKNEEQLYPFPGPSKVRKLRHVGYVAWACFILISLLKKTLQKRLRDIEHLSSLISQAVEELHTRHYLDHNGLVYSTLQDAVKDNAFDFKIKSTGVFQRISQNSQAAFRELSSMIETIVYDVSQIKPSSGLISATRDGVLWHMVQEGTYLPPDYLWQVEKDNMTFTPQGAVAEVTNQVGTMLLLGLFISRGLVSTILLKPTEYGLMEDAPSNIGNSNLKVLGSVLMKIVREVSSWKQKKTIPLASELSSQLFSDYEMKFIYKKLNETLIWCKANLKRWTEAYLDSLNRS